MGKVLRNREAEKGWAKNSTTMAAGVTRVVRIESAGTDAGSVGNNTPRYGALLCHSIPLLIP
jgi:hypothetical protein